MRRSLLKLQGWEVPGSGSLPCSLHLHICYTFPNSIVWGLGRRRSRDEQCSPKQENLQMKLKMKRSAESKDKPHSSRVSPPLRTWVYGLELLLLGNDRDDMTLLSREGTAQMDGLCNGTNWCCFHWSCPVNCEAHLERLFFLLRVERTRQRELNCLWILSGPVASLLTEVA